MSNEDQNRWLRAPHAELQYSERPELLDVIWVSGSAIAVAPRFNPPPEPVINNPNQENQDLRGNAPNIHYIVESTESEGSDTDATIDLYPAGSDSEEEQPERNDQANDNNPALNGNSVIIIERENSDLNIAQVPNEVTTLDNQNAGIENPIIRLENPDYEPDANKSPNPEPTRAAKRSYGVMISEDDDGQTCPVCLDVWTSAGDHRLCCLKCGHLFGKSCISRWLSFEKKKCCPQCNKKASVNDIRELYATKLTALDSAEKVRLEKELDEVKEQKKKVEVELTRTNLTLDSYKEEIDKLKLRISNLEGDSRGVKKIIGKTENIITIKFHLDKTVNVTEGQCRVSAYSSVTDTLIVSHKSPHQVFPGYGVKKIRRVGTDYYGNGFLYLHAKAIRDLCFHPTIPNRALSVAFDKHAKVSDIEQNTVTHTYKASHPLWSCCWDTDDPNIFYAGSGNGIVHVYDIRMPDAIISINSADDPTAVLSLHYSPLKLPFRGGIICCRLNSVTVYEKISATEFNPTHLSELVGPFFSFNYNPETQHVLASCRPSEESSKVRHVYCELTGTTCQKIHTFFGGPRQTFLTRNSFIDVNNGTLFAAFQENSNSIELWSTSTGAKIQSISVSDQILDLVAIRKESKTILGAVSDNLIRFFEASIFRR